MLSHLFFSDTEHGQNETMMFSNTNAELQPPLQHKKVGQTALAIAAVTAAALSTTTTTLSSRYCTLLYILKIVWRLEKCNVEG